jgi:hypothetical protein
VTAGGCVTLVRGLDSVIKCMEASGTVGPTSVKRLPGARSALQTQCVGHGTVGTGTIGRVMSSMQVRPFAVHRGSHRRNSFEDRMYE